MSSFDRFLRKIFPSTSKLTFNPFFKVAANALDTPARLYFKEFRKLPPNHLRVRIGVGNNLFGNHVHYYAGSTNLWLKSAVAGYWNWDSTILDLGCGCGRQAHYLRDYTFEGERFTGQYIGVDIDEEALGWCRKNFDSERFTFVNSTHGSASYAREADSDAAYNLPVEASTVDYAYSVSLFTHLLETELENYMDELARVLKPGGVTLMGVFCIDYPPPTYGGRHTFQHNMGNALVESVRQPEAAVAYTEEYLFELARERGFSEMKILNDPKEMQSTFFCRK